MARIFVQDNNTIAVWGDMFNAEPDPANWTRIARYIESGYAALHQQMSEDTTLLSWNATTQELSRNSVVIIDSAWIAARQAELTQAENVVTEDASERATLLSLYNAAMTQIGNDQTAITNGKTALVAATTLAQVKPIVDGMLTILEHIVNRDERELKALRAILRSGLD